MVQQEECSYVNDDDIEEQIIPDAVLENARNNKGKQDCSLNDNDLNPYGNDGKNSPITIEPTFVNHYTEHAQFIPHEVSPINPNEVAAEISNHTSSMNVNIEKNSNESFHSTSPPVLSKQDDVFMDAEENGEEVSEERPVLTKEGQQLRPEERPQIENEQEFSPEPEKEAIEEDIMEELLIDPIDIEPLLKLGREALRSAMTYDYEILPDLLQANDYDFSLIDVNNLSSEIKRPPKPYPLVPHANEEFYNRRGCVNFWWSDNFVSPDGLKLGIIRKREVALAVREGFQFLDQFKTFMNRIRVSNRIDGLYKFYARCGTEKKRIILQLLHQIVILAARAPELITAPVPFLFTEECRRKGSVTLSQEQCASLLASCFLGLMPPAQDREVDKHINQLNLHYFIISDKDAPARKLPFMLNYFAAVIDKMPTGVVTFRRVAYTFFETDPMKEVFKRKTLSNVFLIDKPIEKCDGALQVDFANKFIGGGVAADGFVQEEIRFLCFPELMISMILCPAMNHNESIFIAGAQQFSSYTGYAATAQFKSVAKIRNPPRDKYRRIMTEIVAIDAMRYERRERSWQFQERYVGREITKAAAGFLTPLEHKPLVATGNWGCGVFGGDLELKCIIQLIAATMAGRDLLYSAFDRQQKLTEFCYLVEKMRDQGWTLEELYDRLRKYNPKGQYNLFTFLSTYLAPPE